MRDSRFARSTPRPRDHLSCHVSCHPGLQSADFRIFRSRSPYLLTTVAIELFLPFLAWHGRCTTTLIMKRAILCAVMGATLLGAGPAFAEDVKMKVLPRGPAEAAIQRRAPKAPVRARLSALVLYAGTSDWSLADAETVQEFFATRFGRPLPVSAWGQTAVHDRLGLDHRQALDVAVHPDSREGRALMAFLRKEGIPFVAIRSRVKGSATGEDEGRAQPRGRLHASRRGPGEPGRQRGTRQRSTRGEAARPSDVGRLPGRRRHHVATPRARPVGFGSVELLVHP